MVLKSNSRIYVAGHRGLVGAAIIRRLGLLGYRNIITRSRQEADLTDPGQVAALFEETRPEFVFVAAARVGGIQANNVYRADFIYQNLMIQNHLIHQSWKHEVKKLLFLGSSCIYPRECPQPIKEEFLLTGPLEPTNRPYAVAKIAGIEMCRAYNSQHHTDFITAMPTNLYGPGDNFNLETSHVLPALIARAHKAKVEGRTRLVVWGSGSPMREFLFVDDLAEACIFLMNKDQTPDLINVGSGQEVCIRELAELVCKVTGFTGILEFDKNKPDGTPRKLLDSGKLQILGWRAETELQEGIESTYAWFTAHCEGNQAGEND